MLTAILSWVVFGFVIGLLARAVFPGTQSLGCFGTTALGVAGALVGGFLSSFVVGYPMFEYRPSGILGSIVGALIVLGLSRLVVSRETT